MKDNEGYRIKRVNLSFITKLELETRTIKQNQLH